MALAFSTSMMNTTTYAILPKSSTTNKTVTWLRIKISQNHPFRKLWVSKISSTNQNSMNQSWRKAKCWAITTMWKCANRCQTIKRYRIFRQRLRKTQCRRWIKAKRTLKRVLCQWWESKAKRLISQILWMKSTGKLSWKQVCWRKAQAILVFSNKNNECHRFLKTSESVLQPCEIFLNHLWSNFETAKQINDN